MNETSSAFHLAGVWQVINKHLKLIASFVAVVLVITALLLFFVIPKSYKSTAVIVAANPVLSDKSRILNSNVQHLYSPYGSGDDLNRLEAIAKLDTLAIALVKEFKMVDYYEYADNPNGLEKAMVSLRKDIEVQKTEHDELHVSVMLKDRKLAASLVNRMVDIMSSLGEISWRNEYSMAYEALQNQVGQTELQLASIADSLKSNSSGMGSELALLSKRAALVEQLQQFYKASNEYQLAFNNRPATLVVLQKAYPAFKSAKPKKLEVLLLAFIATFAFAIVAALIYDRQDVR